MYYVIEQEPELLEFDNTVAVFTINDKIYDVVSSQKNSALERISDFVIENNVFTKSDPRLEKQMKESLKSVGFNVKELLLG